MNTVQLIGRLTTAPELTTTDAGANFVRTTVAVNRHFKNTEGEREADFVGVVFWGKLAETLVAYAKKGMLVSVAGELRAYSYEDKEKERHYVTEVRAGRFEMLESRATIEAREGKKMPELELEAETMPF